MNYEPICIIICLLLGNVSQVSSVAHGPLVLFVPALQALSLPEHQTVKATCSFLVCLNS